MTVLEDPDAFGDADPEDAWYPDDPITDLIANLIRRRARDRHDLELGAVRRVMFDEDLAHVLNRVAALERGS
jgi:hypothetical protein